jgi:hypothetical protein
LIYDFIFPTLAALISFVVLRDLTRSYFAALFIVLLFPFTDQLIPLSFSVALIGIYILRKFIYGPQDLKAHLRLFLGLFFLMIWRIDIGFGALFGFVLALFLYSLSKIISFSVKKTLQSVGIFAAIGTLIGLILYFKGINAFTSARDYLSHISASQSYGFSTLTTDTEVKDVLLFNLHHYVFPVAVLSIGVYLLFNFRKFSASRHTQFALLSLLFCIGFYIGNFQRGLVRHSFMEHTDLYLSSFVFLIFSGSVYLFFKERSQTFKFLGFTLVIFLFITGFKYQEIKPGSLTDLLNLKTKEFKQIERKPNIKRELNPALLEERYKPFKAFIDEELSENETFIDFSNTPMFYYFTGKQTPSFFFQNPICMHNDHLQERFLEDLKKYNTPIILFSRSHQNDEQWGWDYMDFVPNQLRHYKMAEYFYKNYESFTVVKDHCIWRRKGKKFKKGDFVYAKDTYSTRYQNWEIGMIPYLWATYDEKMKSIHVQKDFLSGKVLLKDSVEFELPGTIDRNDGNYVYIRVSGNNAKRVDLKLRYGPQNGEFNFYVPPGNGIRKLAVRISAQYNWYAKENRKLMLSTSTEEKIYLEKMSILRGN